MVEAATSGGGNVVDLAEWRRSSAARPLHACANSVQDDEVIRALYEKHGWSAGEDLDIWRPGGFRLPDKSIRYTLREAIARYLWLLQPEAPPASYVYFVKQLRTRPSLIKIGITTDLKGRLRDLRGGSGLDLELIAAVPGGRDLERRLHEEFADLRKRGEWFENHADLRARADELWREAREEHRVPNYRNRNKKTVWRP